MTQSELNRQVASATGESLAEIQHLGFGLADSLDTAFDPEPRRPLVYDWDSGDPAEWPGI
jgi:hypothetical protein